MAEPILFFREEIKEKREEWRAGHPHPILRHKVQGTRYKAQGTRHKAQLRSLTAE